MSFTKKSDWNSTSLNPNLSTELQRMDDGIQANSDRTNIDTANKLKTPRYINGVSFDGSRNITIKADPTSHLLSTQDLNSVTAPGLYYAESGNSISNKPILVDAFGLMVCKTASGYISQELISGNSTLEGRIYIRTYTTHWSSWSYVYTSKTGPTNVSGNAGTATKLQNYRTFDGIRFDGSDNVNRTCICTTEASTQIKEVSCTNFVIAEGSTLRVLFSNSNTATSPKLRVNESTAYAIKLSGELGYISDQFPISANHVYEFVFHAGSWYASSPVIHLPKSGSSPASPTTNGDWGPDYYTYAPASHSHPMQTTLNGYSVVSNTIRSDGIPSAAQGEWEPYSDSFIMVPDSVYGSWIKIGSLVNCWFGFKISRQTVSSSGGIYIYGLPFECSNATFGEVNYTYRAAGSACMRTIRSDSSSSDINHINWQTLVFSTAFSIYSSIGQLTGRFLNNNIFNDSNVTELEITGNISYMTEDE